MRLLKIYKPEAAASTDTSRPAVTSPWLKGNTVYATDGKIMAVIPVERDLSDVDGPIPMKAFSLARANGGDGVTVSMPLRRTAVLFRRRGEVVVLERKLDMATPDPTHVDHPLPRKVGIALNPSLLLRLAAAIGSPDGIVLSVEVDANGQFMARGKIEVLPVHDASRSRVKSAARGWMMPMNSSEVPIVQQVAVTSESVK